MNNGDVVIMGVVMVAMFFPRGAQDAGPARGRAAQLG